MKEGSLRVLVVEDDTPTRQMLTQFFTDEGFDVAVAHDGEHALRVAAASQPDLVVLDVGLPGLDGSGFAHEWRQRPGGGKVPIVVVSGLPHGDAIADEIGAVAFYGKPLDLDAFGKVVRALAERQRSEAEAAAL